MAKPGLVSIKTDTKQLKQMSRALKGVKNGLRKVVLRALKTTARQVKTVTKNEIRKAVPELPAARVGKRIYISPKATFNKLSTTVRVSWSLIPLKRVKGVRGKGRYPSKSYIKWKGHVYPQAFRATMPSGHVGIFMRKFASGGKPVLSYTGDLISQGQPGPGLPIQELGINVKEVVIKGSGVKQNIEKQSNTKLRVNITKQFNYLISKIRG